MPTLTRFVSSNSPSARVQFSDYLILIREFALCSIVVLSVSAISDHLYFGTWTFPPYQWLSYNISRDLAVFYGRNDWHYFLTQGLPLLLTTYLPFALVALYQSTSKSDIRFLFTTTILTTIGSLSLVSHKEVRFIYPLLPLLHILTAPTINSFFTTTTTKTTHPPPFPSTPKTETITTTHRRPLLALLLLLNLSIGAYTTLFHQAGVISVLKFLRYEYEDLALDIRGNTPDSPDFNKYGRPEDLGVVYEKQTDYDENETFAGFLMPCHSTPWRSQLFYPGLKAWALTCEPPLDIPAGTPERATYRDEADRFYDDPAKFLREEVNTRERPWPRYIVGFESIAPALTEYYEGEAGMPGFRVMERWRAQNSHWHDDERRRGDVVVWEFMDGTKIKAREERKRLEKEMEEESKKNTYWLRDWNVPTLGDLGLEGVFGRAEGDADVQV
jgi:phosphatidylinositol glycan class B